jgi:Translation initiation factor IF-2, N-terminal region
MRRVPSRTLGFALRQISRNRVRTGSHVQMILRNGLPPQLVSRSCQANRRMNGSGQRSHRFGWRPYGGWMAQGKVRVHELAKELGVTSQEILVACSNYGEFIKSASSTLPAPLARRLRADLGGRTNSISPRDYGVSADISQRTVVDDGGFGAAYEKARRQSRSPSFGTHKPGAIESAIYRYAIDPHRTKRGGYTPEERDRAQGLTKHWATTWLPEIVDWIRVSGGEHRDVAMKLSKEGLTPADAELRLGFGRIDTSRDTIVERVSKGTLGIKDAVRQVRDFRRSERSTGS